MKVIFANSGKVPKKPHEINFEPDNLRIHELAVSILLSNNKEEIILKEPKYEYLVSGGGGGALYYRKGTWDYWVLIANWCFYGLYIFVRYRKPLWLRPMYEILFKRMNFLTVEFFDNSIQLLTTEGTFLKSRRFSLTPKGALEKVMKRLFNWSEEETQKGKEKIKYHWP